MDRPWFDSNTNTLLLDRYVPELDSFKRVVADERVTDAELGQQVEHIITLMRQLEGMLSPEAKEVATQVLCELAVLQVLQARNATSI